MRKNACDWSSQTNFFNLNKFKWIKSLDKNHEYLLEIISHIK